MSRDTVRKAPFTVLVPRNSEILTLLERDAEKWGIPISKVLFIRACLSYEQHTTVVATPAAGNLAAQSVGEEDEQEDFMTNGRANAASAADAWLD